MALAAPGGDDGAVLVDVNGCNPNGSDCVLSTFPHDQYGLDEGTSMAAPHVSGAAALLFAENPGRSRADVIHALEATAHPLAGAGSGLLDVGRALAVEPPAAPGGAAPGPSAGGRAAVVQSGGSPVPASPSPGAAGTPAGTAPPNTAPLSPPTTVAPRPSIVDSRAGRRSAIGPTGSSKGSSVALPGGFAAALLLGSGAGAATLARRRRLL